MKKSKIKVLIIAMCVAVFAMMPLTASAANTCSNISGNSKYTKTFTVTTGKGFITGQSIKFTQSKGTITGMWTKKMYASYTITVRYAKSGKVYKRCTWKGGNHTGASYKLKLGKNTKYRITIQPYTSYRGFNTWITPCYWNVSKTRHITLCR